MHGKIVQTPMLDRFYAQFLRDENSSRFINSVAQIYCIPTLEKLALQASRISRRAATLAIGFLSDFRSNEVLGKCMTDSDRAVRMLADHGCRQLWFRQGDDFERQTLRQIARLNSRSHHTLALDMGDLLVSKNPRLAEAWNQRAIACYSLSDYETAIKYCQETVYMNRFHFLSVVGMANSYLQIENIPAALDAFRLAIDINPDLESVRGQIDHLQKIIDD